MTKSNHEKYICYQCELYLQYPKVSLEKKSLITDTLGAVLSLKHIENEITLAIRDQFNETIQFCDYWINNNKSLNI